MIYIIATGIVLIICLVVYVIREETKEEFKNKIINERKINEANIKTSSEKVKKRYEKIVSSIPDNWNDVELQRKKSKINLRTNKKT